MPARAIGGVEPRADLGARLAAVPALERGGGVALGHEQVVAAAVDALAARLGHEPQVAAQVRHGAVRPRDLGGRAGERAAAALDPALELEHGLRRGALGGALREDHLDLAGPVDADAHAPRARRAAHPVVPSSAPMEHSRVPLPKGVREPYTVFVNGVRQHAGDRL